MGAQKVINEARKYLGVSQGTASHRKIIDTYNQVKPLPAGYKVQYNDDWCDIFVTFIGDVTGLSHLIGRECGVERHIRIFEKLGIWRGRQQPKAGDIVTFDWDGNGWADHIGWVEQVSDKQITTIEGNSNRKVERNTFAWADWRIKGYARPNYTKAAIKLDVEEVAQEVIQGVWGTGVYRFELLERAGYDAAAVQNQVNKLLDQSKIKTEHKYTELNLDGVKLPEYIIQQLMSLAENYQILPSLLIVMLHFESLWGASDTAKQNNNWAGMTWSANYTGHPSVTKYKGSTRPHAEGGHYIRYASVNDFITDWVYLLRPGGSYKVSGQKTFEDAVTGLFKIGGAAYDYAALGYTEYSARMQARYQTIDTQNPGKLAKWDAEIIAAFTSESEIKTKVTVNPQAVHWQTGEQIASWVKGQAYDVLESKQVPTLTKAYLLGSDGIPIGWLHEKDTI